MRPPLFIPLMTRFYRAFEDGSKTVELRLYGKRWNEQTCPVGRPVVLSHGYGKKERMQGVISGFSVDVAPTKTDAWRECYGDTPGCLAACIAINLAANPQQGHDHANQDPTR